ncbi:MAG: U32 family peptidase [Lachnospiraceae bacterium]|nr:U32 family peptidase [Lachnospiraceae bacterium]
MDGKRKKPELLMPAGNLEILKTAVVYGADAVYLSGETLSLRAGAKNFSMPEIREGVAFAHAHGAKVYVAANIFAHNADLRPALKFFLLLKNIQPDALILSDPGLFSMAQEVCPEIPVHISTQANNTNYGDWLFWHKLGVKRLVSARELSLTELREIRASIPEEMEIETFVHGAMCVSYSGRCLLSNALTGRDANRGACTHPCRWKYHLVEETRPGEYMPVFEDERGTYLYNSRDLCMIEHVPELADARLDSWKIEGRMKTALYVATVTRAYRQAIDDYFEDPEKYYRRLPWYQEEVRKCTTRRFTTGFFFGRPGAEAQTYEDSTYCRDYIYLGTIETEEGRPFLRQKNKFSLGEELELMRPDGSNLPVTVRSLTDEEGHALESAPHPAQKIYPDLGISLREYDVLRKRAQKEDEKHEHS